MWLPIQEILIPHKALPVPIVKFQQYRSDYNKLQSDRTGYTFCIVFL
jgi:hypothetical protein